MRHSTRIHSVRGFGLIEIMIALVIVAILMAIAWPQYERYTVNSKRTVAGACLVEAGQFMERFYTMNMRYDQTTAGTAVALPQTQCAGQLENDYTFSLSSVSSTDYTLTAQPQGRQATKDSGCGELTLNQRGEQGVSGDTAAQTCW